MRYIDALLAFWERSEFLRFGVIGGINSAVTYCIYLGVLMLVPYAAAYTVSYVVGIVLSYYLTSRFVFKRKAAIRAALGYPAVYVLQYVTGVTALVLLVRRMHIDQRLAPVLVVICSVPVTFVASKFVMKLAPKRD